MYWPRCTCECKVPRRGAWTPRTPRSTYTETRCCRSSSAAPGLGCLSFVCRVENLLQIERVKFQRFNPLHSNTTQFFNPLAVGTTAAAFVIPYVRLSNVYIHPRYSQACANTRGRQPATGKPLCQKNFTYVRRYQTKTANH